MGEFLTNLVNNSKLRIRICITRYPSISFLISLLRNTRSHIFISYLFTCFSMSLLSQYVTRFLLNEEMMYRSIFVLNPINRLEPNRCTTTVFTGNQNDTNLSICSLTPPPRSNVRLFSVIFLIIIATIYCFL